MPLARETGACDASAGSQVTLALLRSVPWATCRDFQVTPAAGLSLERQRATRAGPACSRSAVCLQVLRIPGRFHLAGARIQLGLRECAFGICPVELVVRLSTLLSAILDYPPPEDSTNSGMGVKARDHVCWMLSRRPFASCRRAPLKHVGADGNLEDRLRGVWPRLPRAGTTGHDQLRFD